MHTNASTKRRHCALLLISCGLFFSYRLAANDIPLPESLHTDAEELVTPYLPIKGVPIITPKLTPWVESNQRVGELGGWLFYATEAASDGKNPHEGHQKPAAATHEGHH